MSRHRVKEDAAQSSLDDFLSKRPKKINVNDDTMLSTDPGPPETTDQ